jgi:hypothetical protein
MFVYKGDGFAAGYTIRFRLEAPDAAVLRFDLAAARTCRCSIRACPQR